MAASDAMMTVKVDMSTEALEAVRSVGEELKALRQEIAELRERVQYIRRVEDGIVDYVTDQMVELSRRIQRLENLPGVAEALAAQDEKDERGNRM